MRHCAFLTMDSLDGYVSDDDLVYAPLQNLGWCIHSVSWHKEDVDWAQYDAVLIRTTWDYHSNPVRFLDKLATIDEGGTLLINPLDLVRWNIHKTYLSDLERRGVRIVPSLWLKSIGKEQLFLGLDEFGTDEIIVKPLVSAGARNTFRIAAAEKDSVIDRIVEKLKDRECIVQPFLQKVTTEGEFSVFFFGGTYSHAVLKTPRQYDFRVQEEHGGIIRPITPEKELFTCSQQVMDVLDAVPFYARIDWVRNDDDEYCLMELELIEPSLYFRTDPASPLRFARAFNDWMGCKTL